MQHQQIVSCYESDPGVTFEMLCEAFPQYEPEAIKLALAGGSVRYRAELKKANKELFNEHEKEIAKMAMLGLLGSEKANVVFRAAQYVMNDFMGRHDVKNAQTVNIRNVISIDQRMKRAKQALDRGKDKEMKVIDIEPQAA